MSIIQVTETAALFDFFSFGRSAAHGGVDNQLTSLNQETFDRMLDARDGAIGRPCEVEAKRQQEEYPGPGYEPVKSSIKIGYPFKYKKPNTVGPGKTQKPTQDGPGPGMYPMKLPTGGPSYQFGSRFDDRRVPPTKTNADGSRFDSALRAKPHLKPKKVDGPGPGDYKLADSVQTKKRDKNSTQVSTWGTGREQDEDPNKRKQEFV